MKNVFSLIIITALCLVSLTFAQLAGHYQIGSGGDFLSFSEAIDSLIALGVSDSVIFDVKTGTYREQFILPEINGTDSINTITFKSQAGAADSVILWDSTTSTANYIVKLDSVDYITFKNMTFEAHGTTHARIFHLEHDARDIQIRNNSLNTHFTGTSSENQTAIYAPAGLTYSTQNLQISGNQFNGASYGIVISGRGYSIYYDPGTRITGNTFNTISWGIRIISHQAPWVEGNYVSSSGSGIYLADCKGTLKVLKNRVYFRFYWGIQIASCEGTASERGLIANNFVKETGSSTYLRGIEITYSCFFQDIFYNTVIFEEVGSYGVFRASNAGYPASNMRILNNNFICLDRTFAYTAVPSMISISDYNNIYNASNTLASWGASCPNLDSLQQASGQDLHSISVYPMFPDLNQPYTTHPWLDGAATPLPEVSDDIDGNPRDPNSPDIGCCEFNGNPGSTPYAGVLTVGQGGDFASFSEACDSLLWRGVSGSVKVEAFAGDYPEQLKIRSIPGASWQDTVVFTSQSGNPSDVSLHHTPLGVDDKYTIYIYGADHLCFEFLTLFSDTAAAAPHYRVFDFYGETENIQIRQNRIYGPPYSSITGGDHQLIQMGTLSAAHARRVIAGNYFQGGGTIAIETGGDQSRLYLTDNTFRLMRTTIYASGNSQAPVITRNIMEQIFLNNAYPYAVRLYQLSGPFQVTKNQIQASGRHALYIQSSSGSAGEEALIANNFLIAGGGTGSKYGLNISGSSFLKIYSNNINIVGSSTLTNGRSMNISGSNQLQVVNNILCNSCDGYTYYVDNPGAFITSDFNDIYSSGPNLAYWGVVTVPDLDSLRNLSGMDLSSISVDPGYYEPAGNLHVTNPALDSSAAPLPEITDDFDGDLRDVSYPDIGADEFVPGNCPPYVVNPLPDVIYQEDSGLHLVSADLNTVFSDPNPLDTLRFTFISSDAHIHHHLISDSFFVSADSNFFGAGDMVVIAHDTLGLMCRDTFQIIITNVNDPPRITGLPDTVTFEADTSITLDIWSYVEDPDVADSLLRYLFEPTATALVALYDSANGELTISSLANTNYSAPIYMTVTGDSGLVARDSIMAVVIGVTGIEDDWRNQIPKEFVLMQNYPNPFNPVTTIRYGLPNLARVKIEVFNILGQQVITLFDDQNTAGYHEVRLEANRLGSGIYFYRMTVNDLTDSGRIFVDVKKLMVIK